MKGRRKAGGRGGGEETGAATGKWAAEGEDGDADAKKQMTDEDG